MDLIELRLTETQLQKRLNLNLLIRLKIHDLKMHLEIKYYQLFYHNARFILDLTLFH